MRVGAVVNIGIYEDLCVKSEAKSFPEFEYTLNDFDMRFQLMTSTLLHTQFIVKLNVQLVNPLLKYLT